MVKMFVGGTLGIALTSELVAIAFADAEKPLPPSLLALIILGAITGFLLMLLGWKDPRRYHG
ncbi:MAG: hypothetical protein Q7S48_01060 [bacterium]|nr:hypothetical protein [bacterium]